jgi:hypothetical protein
MTRFCDLPIWTEDIWPRCEMLRCFKLHQILGPNKINAELEFLIKFGLDIHSTH